MNHTSIPWRPLGVILLVAALLIGYNFWLSRDQDQLTSAPAPEQPGYYLKQARVLETQADGASRFNLRADTIQQNPADDSFQLNKVELQYHAETNNEWRLSADTGTLPADTSSVELHGQVRIWPSPDNPTTRNLLVRTESLYLNLLDNIATAPGAITFEMNQQRITGVGLRADLKQQQVHIESQVHGQFSSP